jgi:HAE1 family hydrophobic/amphiphilic exporter-1
MIAKFFIERPVLANVLALVIMLLGVVAIQVLPIAQYPQITPPTISVTTYYPGADAKTLIDTVALPIEQQVNGVENMLYMQSTSTSTGNYSLIVTFNIGTDLNFAQVLVQNRVSAAISQLPSAVQSQGVVVQQKSTAILEMIALTSPDKKFDALYLSNYATINLANTLARLPGVGNVNVFGVGEYAMRVWLDPAKLQAYGLVPSDVLDAIRRQNVNVTAGQLGAPPQPNDQSFQYTVNVAGALADPSQFEQIIVKSASANGGQIVRVRDVGRAELGSQNYNQFSTLDGAPTAAIGIYQLPNANALTVAAEVQATMEQLSKNFPAGMTYSIPFNTTTFVNASVHEVYKTLFEAGILVLVVILVFLQNIRATLVPATTVPVTIIGAFAGMAALGFSINLLTLFGIVLAIGIVVDDAIVVVEGVSQHIERGKSPHDASILAMKELLGPIIGITLVLMAVFLPPAFMPGITGQMYAQFALVIAVTAGISAVNAATLKPTQCALWLRPHDPNHKKNWFYRGFDRIYNPIEAAYVRLIDRMVHRSGVMVAIAAVLVVLSCLGLARIPTGFIPIEDQGYVVISVVLPDSASLARTNSVLAELGPEIAKVPGVDHQIAIGGISLLDNSAPLSNAGVIYVMLKDWSQRGKDAQLLPVYDNLNKILDKVQGARSLVVVPPPIQGLGNSGGFTMQLELQDGSFDYRKLQQAADTLVRNGNAQTGLSHLQTTFRAETPQLRADIDRVKAETLGVKIGDVFDALQTYLGSSYVNLITKFGRTFPVYVQAEQNDRLQPSSISNYYVKNSKGDMVPIGTLASIDEERAPALISLYNLYPTATINGSSAAGYSSGQAMDIMAGAAKALPPGVSYEWTALSYQEKLVGDSAYIIFGLSLLLVYLVLAGQYESWIIPAAVIFAVPLALLGTAGVLLALGLANNVYTQIGLVLLIALASKNAILIVEVAREQRADHGKEILEAAVLAARTRFRPILMTSFAFILGVLPLVFATGASANARRSIGIAVASGMLASTCLAVLFVPSFWVVLQRHVERRMAKKAKPGAPAAPAAPTQQAPR